MNPWMILGMLAGVYGISRIAKSSTAAANAAAGAASGAAAEGRMVTSDANGITYSYSIPIPGKTQSIKGRDGKMHTSAVWSPAKKLTIPWSQGVGATQTGVLLFTATGGTAKATSTKPYYVFMDGNQKVAVDAHQFATALHNAHYAGGGGAASSGASATVAQTIKDAQALIQSASQASDAGQWAEQNAGQIAKVVAEIAAVVATASTADQATLNQLKSQLEAFGIQTGVKVATDLVQSFVQS